MTLSWMTVSPLVKPKWLVLAGMTQKLPAGSAFALLASNLSPRPMLNVPEMTVTCSSRGCQWGGIL